MPARVFQGTPANLRRLAHALRSGELVAVPTETVYGLAGNALNSRACARIFKAKGRPTQDPLIVHVHSFAELSNLAEMNKAARKLAKKFWPGPLTIVLPKKSVVPDIVSAGLPSVAVRMPQHPLFRRLLKETGVPLAAPSANPFGYVSPTSAAHVKAGLGTKIRYILDGGASSIGLESTIVDLRDPKYPRLLRPGAVLREQIETVLRRRLEVVTSTAKKSAAQIAPGSLARHYSPRTPVVLHDRITTEIAGRFSKSEAILLLHPVKGLSGRNVFALDGKGDLRGVARRLFDTLRKADSGKFTRIHVERAPNEGLGVAINDRLRRAAARG